MVPLVRLLIRFQSRSADSLAQIVEGGRHYTVSLQGGGDLFNAHPVQRHAVDAAHNGGGVLVNNPAFGVLRVFGVAKGRKREGFPGVATDNIGQAALFGNILCVLFIGPIPQEDKFIVPHGGVDTVTHRHKADAMFREKVLHQPIRLRPVTVEAGQVFDKEGGCLALFQLGKHFLELRAVGGHAGDTVIIEKLEIAIPFFLCILGKQFLLGLDAVAITCQTIFAGYTAIAKSGVFFAQSVV